SFRTMVKNKGYSLMTLLGLAVGLACFIMILAYVRFETSYDRFHDKADRIFRVTSAVVPPGKKPGESVAWNPDPVASLLKAEFPEVRHATRVMRQFNDPAILKVEEKAFAQSGLFADQDFLEIFTFPFVRGDKSRALIAPGSIVLSERVAKKLFGNEDPVGRPLSYAVRGGQGNLTVTGVMADVPRNSHLQFDYLLSLATLEADKENDYMFKNWDVANFTIYADLTDSAAKKPLEDKFAAWLQKNRPENAKEGLRFFLQPLRDIHLRSNVLYELATNNEIRYIYLFLTVALLTLAIAAVNYMNLVTARASTRAREIGVRKVTGADRRQLLEQFLGESVFFSFLALVAAGVLVRFALPRFSAVAGVNLEFRDLLAPPFLLLVVGSTTVVGLLAGAYPALVLSAFQPTNVLKGLAASGRKGAGLRNILVVGQFTASIVLIICAFVVSGQLRFIRGQRLGFDREHVVVIPFRDPETLAKADAIKAEFLRRPEVESVSQTSGLPTNIRSRMLNQTFTSDTGEKVKTNYHFDYIDENFLKVFKIDLAGGRNLLPDEKDAALVNETFVKTAGWKEALGKELNFFEKLRIVGVVKDFYFRSFHLPLAPMVLVPREGNNLAVRIRPGDVPQTIALLKRDFESVSKSQPWDFSFLDDEFNALYRKEERTGQIFGAFAFLTIFIACLGLLGLAAFAVERRTKEIGIRKVMGASASQLAVKLSREFVLLVILANIIAWPAAYYAMSRWLQAFAYRIGLRLETFILAALGALAVAVLTVSTQTVRAASADPVDSLRYE
ncbi:MAG: ABC transporter permease, partial [Candidatus Aminicenantes bacterium]|nr:ABC transporter permease [Candidatus Aminicenantes bacterium]